MCTLAEREEVEKFGDIVPPVNGQILSMGNTVACNDLMFES